MVKWEYLFTMILAACTGRGLAYHNGLGPLGDFPLALFPLARVGWIASLFGKVGWLGLGGFPGLAIFRGSKGIPWAFLGKAELAFLLP